MAASKNLKLTFKAVVGSDIKEWKMTREIAGGKGVIVRKFEHAATKDKIQITEQVKYDPVDEMDVTTMHVSGTFRGKDVSGTMLHKPTID